MFLVFSCSLDYRSAIIAEELLEKIPDTILINFVHTYVKENRMEFRLVAQRAEMFGRKKITILRNVKFEEYNKAGEVVTSGQADYAVFHTDTENAELKGNIKFYSSEEEAFIYAESLTWEKENKILLADPEDEIIIQKDDGSYIYGRGFRADFKSKSLLFSDNVSGRYVDEED